MASAAFNTRRRAYETALADLAAAFALQRAIVAQAVR